MNRFSLFKLEALGTSTAATRDRESQPRSLDPSRSPDGRTISFHLRYDNGLWSEDSNVIVSRTGETHETLHCIPSSPPSFELESYDTGTAWSPDGQRVAADGVAVCRTDGSTGWLSLGLEADWQRRIHR